MPPKKKFRIVPFLLVLLPVWVIASAAFGLVKYFKDQKTEAIKAEQRFAQSVSIPSVTDDLRKIVALLAERNTATPEKLSATASMIEGSLGPSNTGYTVRTVAGGGDFPILEVTIPSENQDAPPIWILTSYDSPIGSRGAEKNASGLVATLATARELANSKPARPVRFVFLPHVNDTESPVLETAALVRESIVKFPSPKALLCVEAMGDAEPLMLTSRDTEALPTRELDGLGKIVGAEVACLGDDFDLASTLFEMGLPAIRVATRPTLLPDETDEKLPFAPTVAASTGRLIELVKRLAK